MVIIRNKEEGLKNKESEKRQGFKLELVLAVELKGFLLDFL